MIRISIKPDDPPMTDPFTTPRGVVWTVSMADGGNNKTLLSSTSQGYDRFSRADELARRICPRGPEPVELVVKTAAGKITSREVLWTEGNAAAYVRYAGAK